MVAAKATDARKFQRLWETLLAEDPALIDYRLSQMEESMKRIASAFERLTRIEERHDETRSALMPSGTIGVQLTDHEARLRKIEAEMPTNILTSKWTISGLLAIAAIVGVAVIRIVMAIPAAFN